MTPDRSAALSGASERAPGTVTRRVLTLAIGAVLMMLLGSFGLGTSRDSLGSSFCGLEGATRVEETGERLGSVRAASAIGECFDALDSPSILTMVFPSTHDRVVVETSLWLGVRTPGPSRLVVASLSRLSTLADSAASEDLKGISRAFKDSFVLFGLQGTGSRASQGMLIFIELVSVLMRVF